MDGRAARSSFDRFVEEAEPQLRRAIAGHLPLDVVPDAVGEALAFAWEHWAEVERMDRPVGYLFRVAQSRSRRRRSGHLIPAEPRSMPDFEPRLGPAMRSLSERQRSVIWLVCACEWSHREAAEALGLSPSSLAVHLRRAMSRLRRELGVIDDGSDR